jgi:hypothetical protein
LNTYRSMQRPVSQQDGILVIIYTANCSALLYEFYSSSNH